MILIHAALLAGICTGTVLLGSALLAPRTPPHLRHRPPARNPQRPPA